VGKKIIQQISTDLKEEFPSMSGFSLRNLQYMRSFFDAYNEDMIMQCGVAQLPWGHNVTLLDKLQLTGERIWYAKKSIENGWSRDLLILQIETGLFNRLGSALTNFQANLPKAESDLAQQILKTPIILSF
jgi:predicted nuclease of restriction endonuclease-like (RecB) superfamily